MARAKNMIDLAVFVTRDKAHPPKRIRLSDGVSAGGIKNNDTRLVGLYGQASCQLLSPRLYARCAKSGCAVYQINYRLDVTAPGNPDATQRARLDDMMERGIISLHSITLPAAVELAGLLHDRLPASLRVATPFDSIQSIRDVEDFVTRHEKYLPLLFEEMPNMVLLVYPAASPMLQGRRVMVGLTTRMHRIVEASVNLHQGIEVTRPGITA